MGLNLSENIRKNRRESNLSQETFAERLGVSFQTISKWERGECYPDIEMLPKIANFFGITIDALMGADQSQEKEYVKPTEGFAAKYTCMQPTVCYTTKGDNIYAMALKYPDETLTLQNIEQPTKNMKVTLLGCNKELKWNYNNDTKTLTIDTKTLKYSDLKSDAVWVFKLSNY